jgi:hypothetical protein
MSLQETSFDYEGVVWTCALLPYQIIACRDAIQYIVQVRNEKAYRSLSYFSEWEPIGRHYPELAMAGLPLNSPEVLSHEVRRRVMRLGHTAADRAIRSPAVPKLEKGS